MISLKKPIIWAVAGSDCSGGAGIQGDCLTIQGLGGHACTLITAVTAQNSVKLKHVGALSAADLAEQWSALQSDMAPDAIKIGMLANEEQLVFIAQQIAKMRLLNRCLHVVWDPVLSASVGGLLSPFGAQQLAYLAPYVDVITPNIEELQRLTNIPIRCDQDIDSAVACLFEMGCKGVLVKGGHRHWANEIEDRLYTKRHFYRFSSTRIDTQHGHGTGCCLSSAMAVALAKGFPTEDAVCIAKAYVFQGLRAAYHVGQGSGPIAHLGWPSEVQDFPMVTNVVQPLPAVNAGFAPLVDPDIGLYPVVDSEQWVRRLLQCGVKTVQLRIKHQMNADIEAMIERVVLLGEQFRAQVFINDHWQEAIKYGAYGVHLGQEDLAQADLAKIQQAGIRLGVSTHGYAEILRVLPLSPSYIALGHIFPTKTKDMPSQPQGIEKLGLYQKLIAHIPTVAIGGINQDRLASVQQQGVSGIAMVTAITESPNPEMVVRELMEVIDGDV